uniref:Uncharacterized protein n=1 Tax=Chrysotila carterae TaxID=13221 RepID=A0A7S4BZJ0_CHRCT
MCASLAEVSCQVCSHLHATAVALSEGLVHGDPQQHSGPGPFSHLSHVGIRVRERDEQILDLLLHTLDLCQAHRHELGSSALLFSGFLALFQLLLRQSTCIRRLCNVRYICPSFQLLP